MIDLNSKRKLTDRINHQIDEALQRRRDKEPARQYLGFSALGGDCDRQIQYQYMAALGIGWPAAKFKGRILRIFERGHQFEAMAREWFNEAGFQIVGDQTRAAFGAKIYGHCDGIFVGQSDLIPLPAVWECKGLKHSSFMKFKKDKLKKFSDTYWGQVHLNMKGLSIDRCLFTVIDADTMEMHHELIEVDHGVADSLITKGEWILNLVKNQELAPRCTGDSNYFKCKNYPCDFYEHCWSE